MWQEKSEKWKVQQEENLKSKKKQSIKRVEHGKSATFKQYNMKKVEHEKISKKSLTQKICNMKRVHNEKNATWKECNRRLYHGKSKTRSANRELATQCNKECNTENVQHEESIEIKKYQRRVHYKSSPFC